MDTLADIDWSLLQSFLAVAETGSLSAAARRLGKTQPTIGRHVQTLEDDLGVSLFRRQVRGMELTSQGEGLLEHARKMRAAADALNLAAAGRSTDLSGTVRLTASETMSHHVLPPVLAKLRAELPQIQIEIVASDRTENLLFREADIAVRMYRPKQLDMVRLFIGEIELGLFGARSYFARKGKPETASDLMQHEIIGFDRDEEIVRGFRAAGFPVTRDFFPVRTDNQTVYWELVRAGAGLGFGQVGIGAADPRLERVTMELAVPTLEVWLTAHEALRRTPRVDAVWRALAEALPAACDRPAEAAP
jgi:DNA-binding transcriptional LysR family regulator